MDADAESLISHLCCGLAPADRDAFRRAAETALATSSPCWGPGVTCSSTAAHHFDMTRTARPEPPRAEAQTIKLRISSESVVTWMTSKPVISASPRTKSTTMLRETINDSRPLSTSTRALLSQQQWGRNRSPCSHRRVVRSGAAKSLLFRKLVGATVLLLPRPSMIGIQTGPIPNEAPPQTDEACFCVDGWKHTSSI